MFLEKVSFYDYYCRMLQMFSLCVSHLDRRNRHRETKRNWNNLNEIYVWDFATDNNIEILHYRLVLLPRCLYANESSIQFSQTILSIYLFSVFCVRGSCVCRKSAESESHLLTHCILLLILWPLLRLKLYVHFKTSIWTCRECGCLNDTMKLCLFKKFTRLVCERRKTKDNSN